MHERAGKAMRGVRREGKNYNEKLEERPHEAT